MARDLFRGRRERRRLSRMEYAYEFVDGPFQVIVTTSGTATEQEIVGGRRRLFADPRFRPEMNVLYDHSQLELGDASTAEIRLTAESAARDDRNLGRTGFVAVVAPVPVVFGVTRMFNAFLSDDFEERTVVVSSVEDAYRWLAERES